MSIEWIHHSHFLPSAYQANKTALMNYLSLSDSIFDQSNLFLRKSRDGLVESAIQDNDVYQIQFETGSIDQLRQAQQQEISQFSPIHSSNVVYVLGCDLGYSLEMLSSYLSQASHKAAVVIEPDKNQLELTLAARDLGPWLNSNRIDWAVGGHWKDQLRELIWQRNFFSCSQPDFLFSFTARRPERTADWAQLQTLVRQSVSEGKSRFQRQFSDAESYYANKTDFTITKLLAPSTASDPAKAVPYIQERVLDECRKNKVKVVYHEPGFRSDIALLKQIAAERPDAMMMINRSPGEFAQQEQFDRLQMPRFVWCIDDPNCFVGNAFGRHDFVFTWDKAYTEDLRNKNAQSVDHFPYVADMDKAPAQFEERFSSPVSYIGQVKCLDAEELGLSDSEAQLVQKAGRLKAQHRNRSYQSLLLELQSDFGLNLIKHENDVAPRQLRYATYIVANAHWRIAVLDKARPFGLKIYGNDDWKAYLQNNPLADCFCGPADPERDAPNIFYSSKVNLNIHSLQALTSLNQRDFNCPLVGGFILTDWVEGAEDFFEPDVELAFYHNLNELEDKLAFFLEHDDERRQLIERGQARVLRDHVYSVRAPKAFETFQQRIQERYEAAGDE